MGSLEPATSPLTHLDSLCQSTTCHSNITSLTFCTLPIYHHPQQHHKSHVLHFAKILPATATPQVSCFAHCQNTTSHSNITSLTFCTLPKYHQPQQHHKSHVLHFANIPPATATSQVSHFALCQNTTCHSNTSLRLCTLPIYHLPQQHHNKSHTLHNVSLLTFNM